MTHESRAPAVLASVPSRSCALVPRDRLVRLLASTDVPVAVVAAPAGYGKTTLLEAWADADPRTFAWIRVARRPAEPPVDALPEVRARLDALRARGRPFVLVIDDADALPGPESALVLGELAGEVPQGSMLVISARAEPSLPIGRLRAHRLVVELGVRELAMTHGEAAALLGSAGVRADARQVERALARTEGWPAALSLAAISVAGEQEPADAIGRFDGEERIVADYVQEELLCGLSAERMEFLLRTSILDPVSGDACDAMLGMTGSGRELRSLARSELPVSAADRAEKRFHYHPLLAQMLQAELHRSEPAVESDLHRRASAWYDQQGDDAGAIEHAIAGADFDVAGELVWRIAPTHAWDGRLPMLQRWLRHIPARQLERRSSLALAAATACLAAGRRDEMERWTAAAERQLGRAPGRPTMRAGAALMRAAAARNGASDLRRQAAAAAELVAEDSPLRALSSLLEGTALALIGDDGGRALLEDGVRRGAVVAAGLEALSLAQLGALALFEGDWEQGAALAERARSRADVAGLDDQPTLALVRAVSAFARAYRGRPEDARADIGAARRLLDRLDGFAPWLEAPARIALARAELRMSNVAEARALIAQAAKVARRIPDAGLLRRWTDDAWARADTFAIEALSGPSSLTTAELRVLRFLPSHLSFREIAERLHVSANTVKTQAHAVYRKLDASSRSGAVTRGYQLGLLDR